MKKIVIVFGTRPECIKLYPVIEALKQYKNIKTILVNTQQQKDLADSFTKQFKLKPTYELNVMVKDQPLNWITSVVVGSMDKILSKEKPDLLLVQGDTTTAMAAALAAFNNKVPVAHVEAGLRTHDNYNPYPEELNRKLISQLATYNFCPTESNAWFVRHDGKHWITGNTSIDVIKSIKPKIMERDYKQILLTLHRRENVESGKAANYINSLLNFIYNKQIIIKWIIHPSSFNKIKDKLEYLSINSSGFNVKIVDPLPYDAFINECYNSDLILSDSGGIQEEITIIKKPLFTLREVTERPEVLNLPFVKLIKDSCKLSKELEKFFSKEPVDYSKKKYDIFGKGDSGKRIAKIIATKILK